MLSSEEIHQSTKLTLSILGNLTLEDDLGNHIKISNRKACGLLAYLAINGTSTETRERLAGLLWSDRGEEQARASLRQCLKQLRTIFDDIGFTGFETDRQDVSLAPGHINIDIQTIAEAVESGTVPGRLLNEGCEPQKILYGFESLDQSFAAWLHVIRQNWHDRLVDHLQRLLRSADETNTKYAAEALVKVDPTHEEAHRHLIRRHADEGNTAAALNQYKSLWDLLDEEFDMEPDERTLALIADIKAGTYAQQATDDVGADLSAELGVGEAVAAPTPPKHPSLSLAVRYPVLQIRQFLPGGPTKDGASLVEGFRRDLLASLVRFRDWVVVGAQAGTGLSADSSASRTDDGSIDYEVDGTFFDDEGVTHLVVTLKSRETGQYIWSERLKLTLDNWFAAQRRFVMRISAGLSMNLSAQHIAQHITQHEVSEDTYNLWLDAYRLIWSWVPADRQSAERKFRQIIERSPSFAPAYSGLASIYNTEQVIHPGRAADLIRLGEAARLAQIAVSLDPLDVRNQVALAWSYAMIGRFDQAEIHHKLVYELNPNNPTTLISCANGLAMCGDTDTAMEMTNEAIRVLPSITPVQWAYISSTRFVCGDEEGCVEAAKLAGDSVPMVSGWCAAALGRRSQKEVAYRAAQHFLEVTRRLWAESEGSCDAHIIRWFLNHCPLRDERVREKMREGLAKAGLPQSG